MSTQESETPDHWARLFHETYERLAPSFGYETRKDTTDFDPHSNNGRLMIAVCSEVVRAVEQRGREEVATHLEALVNRYEINGEPGDLGGNCWGWRSIAQTYRDEAAAIRARDFHEHQ